ncbi:SDR family oxidoreductase [Halomarina oriensis]|uniref:Glucose 1-dehydrogenase n=1 Tax=Halomarina oriensis TaxID=671145 RepID=A0A6B0GI05_9EURY|nr:SDR family oxidoreductase [Halomarina oriensis]MWG33431.1 glucose 1-dehydrogenase [Halomarina oriensis]
MSLLDEKTVVVTGGASGNGRAIAKTSARHGADVVVADIQETPREGGVPTHEWIEDNTDRAATFVECDVTSTAALERAVDTADEFGGIDVMVNNAGVISDTPLLELDETEYRRVTDVNVKGVVFGTKVAGLRLLERGGGAIVNVSSTLGIRGSGAYPLYSATKGAVRMLTYSTAETLSPDVRVNAVHPGTIETRMNVEDIDVLDSATGEDLREGVPAGRFGRPEEVADSVVYLASEMASYVTGSSLLVDGGETNV